MKRALAVHLLYLLLFFLAAGGASAQDDQAPISTFEKEQQALCTAQPISGQRSYSFREPQRPPIRAGWFVRKPWWQRWFPFLSAKEEERFQVDDIRYMETKIGRPIPVGQSTRTKKITSDMEQFLNGERERAEIAWNEWLAAHPEASPDDRSTAERSIRLKGSAAVNLPGFDWRENGLELGDVGFQGFDCNTCWAFASVDAVQIARRIAVMRDLRGPLDEGAELPSARQLISCMVPAEKYCSANWHGAALTFMIENGLPLGGSDRYDSSPGAHLCDADKILRPLTWGYLSDSPQKVSTPEDIKRGVITYGAVVTMLTFDRCLWLYGDGVFNEEQNRDGSHILLIVGWDDTKGKKGAWLVKNSYGFEWGRNGYGWIEYGSNNIGQFSAVVIADPKEKIEDRK